MIVNAAPVTTHPRLWLTSEDLPRLRAWATNSNPMYANGLKPAVDDAIHTYNTRFYPNGQPNPNWPDNGGYTWVQYSTEAYAQLFAFMSLVDPDPNARAQHAVRARNLLMHVINKAAQGVADQPFRHPKFSTFDRSRWWGEGFPTTVDWIYPHLSASDKAAIRAVFLRWCNENLNANSTDFEHPQPVGMVNNPQLLSNKLRLRVAANNYYAGHMRNLTMMALSMDAADDPPVNPSQPPTQLGNTLRSYIGNATGAWLYQQYAIFEEPGIVSASLGVPPNGLGVASGGMLVEGTEYGASMGFVHMALLALHTAGYNDVSLSGPQIGLINSAYWDRTVNGFLHQIAPTSKLADDPQLHWMGQLYKIAAYGDTQITWAADFPMYGSIGILDQLTGNPTRLQKVRWIAQNALEGGAAKLHHRASNFDSNSTATDTIFYFMLFDPSAATANDPRPSLPLTFIDNHFGRLLSRSGWTPNATWFTYMCHWTSIDHQIGNSNQFELYRKGEWLIKERSGYKAGQVVGYAPDYHNIVGIQNDQPFLSWIDVGISARGGQWVLGSSAGDPTFLMSAGNGYSYALGDATTQYNKPNVTPPANDVTHASRSIVYLKPDHVVVYDRATTNKPNRFKRFWLNVTANPTISGKSATVNTPGGQKLYVQTILPSNATLTALPAETDENIFGILATDDPTRFRIRVEDTNNPTSVRFLNVIQGADGNAAADPTTLIQSNSGTAFTGAAVKGVAVIFPVNLNTTFSSLTYIAPAGTTAHLVTGLTPNTSYAASVQNVSGGVQVTVSAGSGFTTDNAGVLLIGSLGSGISPTGQSFNAGSGTGSVTVTQPAGVNWTATSNNSWITVTSGGSGTGNGTVNYSVAANAGSARTGTMTVAGQTFTVTQSAGSCTFSISPATASYGAGGGTGAVSVTAGAGCTWTTTNNNGWVTVTGNGSGNGTVNYSVAANTGIARTGTMTIAGQTFTVNQSSGAPPLNIITTSVPNIRRGKYYSQALQATGGTPTYNWTLESGSLPLGMWLDPATGIIRGKAVLKGSWTFTVRVQDSQSGVSTKQFTISITL